MQTEINRIKLENDLKILKAEQEMLNNRLNANYQAESNNPVIRSQGL